MSFQWQRAVEKLVVKVFSSREDMGKAAADNAAAWLRELLKVKGEASLMFAAAPSQNEFLAALAVAPGIDWGRVTAFHMDEYIGLDPVHPAGFGNFLDRHIWGRLPLGKVHYLGGQEGAPEDIAAAYAHLLAEYPIDGCFMGVGENGHIAFNDPPVADFADSSMVKLVELDLACRTQQVNDGCFPALEEVPTHALTVTVPGIMAADRLFCMVPGARKADAVRQMLEGPVEEACPASILRRHPNACLYLDEEAAAQLTGEGEKV